MPPTDLTFRELCEHVGASGNTVRRLRDRLEIRGFAKGNVLLYTPDEAELIKAEYARNGGRWPRQT